MSNANINGGIDYLVMNAWMYDLYVEICQKVSENVKMCQNSWVSSYWLNDDLVIDDLVMQTLNGRTNDLVITDLMTWWLDNYHVNLWTKHFLICWWFSKCWHWTEESMIDWLIDQ